ncbi:hypothetical protein QR680_003870 [Steinernema hermaphroditum]|uniref:Uncharacterized protein n=1 Tax=Steinernema hermaphroditum TaxID=289476 RepID=A0AA39LT13_9BILA|nr:hypothetical protein QR680_003870 [Steinernema hermaphroditum]
MSLFATRPTNNLSQKYLTFSPRLIVFCVCERCRDRNQATERSSERSFEFELCSDCIQRTSWLRRSTFPSSQHLREASRDLQNMQGLMSPNEVMQKTNWVIVTSCDTCRDKTGEEPDEDINNERFKKVRMSSRSVQWTDDEEVEIKKQTVPRTLPATPLAQSSLDMTITTQLTNAIYVHPVVQSVVQMYEEAIAGYQVELV